MSLRPHTYPRLFPRMLSLSLSRPALSAHRDVTLLIAAATLAPGPGSAVKNIFARSSRDAQAP